MGKEYGLVGGMFSSFNHKYLAPGYDYYISEIITYVLGS